MKLMLALCAGLLAALANTATAHPTTMTAPPAPPAPPALPAIAPPPLPPLPPAPPLPVVPEEAIEACAGKADGARIDISTADGMRLKGTCSKSHGKIRVEIESLSIQRSSSGKH